MLARFKQFFDSLSPNQPLSAEERQHNMQLAVAVLMLEMIQMDGASQASELEQMANILNSKFALTSKEIDDLMNQAKLNLQQSTDYYQFTSLIDSNYCEADKIEIIEFLWQIALADGHLDAHETHYLKKIHSLLHVSHKDYIQAKERAESHLKNNP